MWKDGMPGGLTVHADLETLPQVYRFCLLSARSSSASVDSVTRLRSAVRGEKEMAGLSVWLSSKLKREELTHTTSETTCTPG